MPSVELKHEGLEIKFFETAPEHAKEYGFESKKPIYLSYLFVDVKKRNRGNGKGLLKMIEDYCKKHKYDLIFGTIPNDAEFTKDSRTALYSDIEMIKTWLLANGYYISNDCNEYYKVLKPKNSLKYYGGIGFGNCKEVGNYEVIDEKTTKKFNKFSEAKEYYDSIKSEKTIWDLTNDLMLDAWYYI
jgi:GNAT superfamily N-acetyltransferase